MADNMTKMEALDFLDTVKRYDRIKENFKNLIEYNLSEYKTLLDSKWKPSTHNGPHINFRYGYDTVEHNGEQCFKVSMVLGGDQFGVDYRDEYLPVQFVFERDAWMEEYTKFLTAKKRFGN